MTPRTHAHGEGPLRVLVVDDDVDAAWTLAAVLHDTLDCRTRIAYEGAEAVDAASEMRPDVVLMDISMSGLDGLEAARVLHALFTAATVPRLIAITGLPPDAHPAILAAGFDACLEKPVDLARLVALLEADALVPPR
jgi:CheY-like chemotaxis protein